MTDDKWKTLQGLKDELFKTKDEASFNEVVDKIGSFVKESDMTEPQKQKLRDYTNNLKQKKKDWWNKQANKPQYQKKEVYLLRPETEEKLQTVLDLIAKRLAIPEQTEPAAPARQLKAEFRKNYAPNEDLPALCPGEPSRYVKRITDNEVDPYEK